MSTLAITSIAPRKKSAPLVYFLGFVFALFIGILIFCYVVTKRTNPIMLDEHGKPKTSSSDNGHAGH
jgi:hypothetical protein